MAQSDVLEWWVTSQQHTRPRQFHVEEVLLGGKDKVAAEREGGGGEDTYEREVERRRGTVIGM